MRPAAQYRKPVRRPTGDLEAARSFASLSLSEQRLEARGLSLLLAHQAPPGHADDAQAGGGQRGVAIPVLLERVLVICGRRSMSTS